MSTRMVRLIMMTPVYKRHNWTIPIEKIGDRFITGQNLTLKKQLGEEALTPDEQKLYPVVINPNNLYKGVDRKIYYLEDPNDKAMYELMLATKRIAKSESEYKRSRTNFLGYFFDAESDARDQLSFFDKVFEAERRIRDIPITEYPKFILALNYKVTDSKFVVPTKGISPDRMKYELLQACRTWPQEVLECFNDVNPGIDEEIFFMDCLNHNIITQKEDGTFMYGASVLGSTFDDIKKYLMKEDRAYLRSKWALVLDERKGLAEKGSADKYEHKILNLPSDPVDRFNEIYSRLKASLFDKDEERSIIIFSDLKKSFKEVRSMGKEVMVDMNTVEQMILNTFTQPEPPVEIETVGTFENMTLEQLQKHINNPKNKIKRSEFKEIIKDRDALIKKLDAQHSR